MNKLRGVFLVLSLLLTSCSGQSFPRSNTIKVGVETSDSFTTDEKIKEVEKGEDVSFDITFRDGLVFTSASYENNEITNQVDNTFTITFKEVLYPTMISLNFSRIDDENTIIYHSGVPSKNPIIVNKNKVHLKENSINGYLFYPRNGYIPIGWNDKSNYTGNLISFGSRIPYNTNDLYLQWEKETSLSDFKFKEVEGGFEITQYLGDDEKVVVPMFYNNHPIISLAKNSFQGEKLKTLVLSKNMQKIANRAVHSPHLETVYLCDSITEIEDNSFLADVKTVRINAIRKPCYSGNYMDTFPDKIDYLESIKDEQKIILFSGSSTRFGYYSPAMEEILTDYKVVNMGVYAYVNIKPQLDIITHFTKENDIILSSPEFDNHCLIEQFGEDNDFEWELFAFTESNYDLISLIDVSKYNFFYSSFKLFQYFKTIVEEKDYTVSPKHYDDDGNYYEQEIYNIQGDIILDRPGHPRDEWIMQPIDEYRMSTTITVDRINSLNAIYQSLIDKNLRVFFTFFPKNRNCISNTTTRYDIEEIENYLREHLLAPVISKWEDSILPGTCFYLIDNHLCTSAALERSIRVAYELLEALK